MKAIAIVLLGLVAVCATAAVTTSDCSGADVVCKSLGLELNADPSKGNPIGMKWKLTCGQHEFVNNLHIYVAFNGFSFHEEENAQSLEVAGGAQTEIDYAVTIPSFAPSVKKKNSFNCVLID